MKELLGVDLPIIQAPMAGVQGHELAIAVSNAGGLGSLPCAMLSSEGLRNELAIIKRQTTKPYNVNFFCHVPPAPDDEVEKRWLQTLSPYFSEYGIDANTQTLQSGRSPFNAEAAEILEEFKPPVVSFHFGLPEPELLERVRGWGGKILSTATTVDEALWLEAHGVDAIIAQGLEAGGHRGFFLSKDPSTQVGTFALIPQIVRSVSVPVIAAGGIADAKGVAAAMELGATAVQIGTAYLLCPEATTTAMHRAALKRESARVTALTNLFSGGLARGIVNRLIDDLGPINRTVPDFPLASAAIAPLRAKAESLGSGEFSPLWAGQNVSGCKEISAMLLTQELAGLYKNAR